MATMADERLQEPGSAPQGNEAATAPPIPIEELPEQLGYVETEAQRQLREPIVEALTTAKDLADRYDAQAQQSIEALGGKDYNRAQLGWLIAKALIQRDAGRLGNYIEELTNALRFANAEGLSKLAAILETEIENAVAVLHQDGR